MSGNPRTGLQAFRLETCTWWTPSRAIRNSSIRCRCRTVSPAMHCRCRGRRMARSTSGCVTIHRWSIQRPLWSRSRCHRHPTNWRWVPPGEPRQAPIANPKANPGAGGSSRRYCGRAAPRPPPTAADRCPRPPPPTAAPAAQPSAARAGRIRQSRSGNGLTRPPSSRRIRQHKGAPRGRHREPFGAIPARQCTRGSIRSGTGLVRTTRKSATGPASRRSAISARKAMVMV
jgi:hypothetical protein